uniref:Uncharacterized protein n=1 Tax=Oryza meridionalis TaxID=40149 RepID=A0A0E0D4I6_9ORYZ
MATVCSSGGRRQRLAAAAAGRLPRATDSAGPSPARIQRRRLSPARIRRRRPSLARPHTDPPVASGGEPNGGLGDGDGEDRRACSPPSCLRSSSRRWQRLAAAAGGRQQRATGSTGPSSAQIRRQRTSDGGDEQVPPRLFPLPISSPPSVCSFSSPILAPTISLAAAGTWRHRAAAHDSGGTRTAVKPGPNTAQHLNTALIAILLVSTYLPNSASIGSWCAPLRSNIYVFLRIWERAAKGAASAGERRNRPATGGKESSPQPPEVGAEGRWADKNERRLEVWDTVVEARVDGMLMSQSCCSN